MENKQKSDYWICLWLFSLTLQVWLIGVYIGTISKDIHRYIETEIKWMEQDLKELDNGFDPKIKSADPIG